jgi:MFS family permease
VTAISNKKRLADYLHKYRVPPGGTRLLLVNTVFSSAPLGMIVVIQPLYLKALGYTSSSIGLLLGIASLSSMLFMVPGSLLSDCFGRKRVLMVSIVAYALYMAVFSVSSDVYLLALASILSGFSWGVYSAPFTARLAAKVGVERRSYVFSFNSFLFSLATILGNLSSGLVDVFEDSLLLSPITSYKVLFVAGAIVEGLAIIPLLQLTEEKRSASKDTKIVKLKAWKVVKKFSFVNFLVGFGAGLFIPFLPLYLNMRYAASEALIGTVLAASDAVVAIAFLASPSLVERIGAVRTVVVTQGLSIIPFVMMPLPIDVNAFTLLYAVRTVLMNMASPIFTAYMMSVVDGRERASVSGITTMAWVGGNAVSSFLGGYLMDIYLDLPIYLCSVLYVLATSLCYFFFHKLDPKH